MLKEDKSHWYSERNLGPGFNRRPLLGAMKNSFFVYFGAVRFLLFTPPKLTILQFLFQSQAIIHTCSQRTILF